MNATEARTMFEAIAAELHAKVDNLSDDRCNIVMPSGARLFLIVDEYRNKGKLRVSGSFPYHQHRANGDMYPTVQRDFNQGPTLDAINITYTKSTKQIASDIVRRYLQDYEVLWHEAVAYCQRQADYFAGVNSIAAVAEEVLKPFTYSSTHPARVDYIGSDGARVLIDNLKADDLRKLAAFLHTL